MKQLLLIEDDLTLGRGIALALADEERQCQTAGSLAEGRKVLSAGCWDLVILDLNLPDGSGLELLPWLRRQSNVPVLILTAKDLEQDQVRGLELGADDYVTKPFSLAVLRARVNSLLRRQTAKGALILPPFSFDFEQMLFFRGETPLDLSKTEQRLLRLLVEHRGVAITRRQLLEQIWDGGEFVDENALSVAMKRLCRKLGENPVKTVYGVGYLWEV